MAPCWVGGFGTGACGVGSGTPHPEARSGASADGSSGPCSVWSAWPVAAPQSERGACRARSPGRGRRCGAAASVPSPRCLPGHASLPLVGACGSCLVRSWVTVARVPPKQEGGRVAGGSQPVSLAPVTAREAPAGSPALSSAWVSPRPHCGPRGGCSLSRPLLWQVLRRACEGPLA